MAGLTNYSYDLEEVSSVEELGEYVDFVEVLNQRTGGKNSNPKDRISRLEKFGSSRTWCVRPVNDGHSSTDISQDLESESSVDESEAINLSINLDQVLQEFIFKINSVEYLSRCVLKVFTLVSDNLICVDVAPGEVESVKQYLHAEFPPDVYRLFNVAQAGNLSFAVGLVTVEKNLGADFKIYNTICSGSTIKCDVGNNQYENATLALIAQDRESHFGITVGHAFISKAQERELKPLVMNFIEVPRKCFTYWQSPSGDTLSVLTNEEPVKGVIQMSGPSYTTSTHLGPLKGEDLFESFPVLDIAAFPIQSEEVKEKLEYVEPQVTVYREATLPRDTKVTVTGAVSGKQSGLMKPMDRVFLRTEHGLEETQDFFPVLYDYSESKHGDSGALCRDDKFLYGILSMKESGFYDRTSRRYRDLAWFVPLDKCLKALYDKWGLNLKVIHASIPVNHVHMADDSDDDL